MWAEKQWPFTNQTWYKNFPKLSLKLPFYDHNNYKRISNFISNSFLNQNLFLIFSVQLPLTNSMNVGFIQQIGEAICEFCCSKFIPRKYHRDCATRFCYHKCQYRRRIITGHDYHFEQDNSVDFFGDGEIIIVWIGIIIR